MTQEHDLPKGVIRVINGNANTVGTAFIVDERLAVTCAHVVKAAGSGPGGSLQVCFPGDTTNTPYPALVSKKWLEPDQGDVAFLIFEKLPKEVNVLKLADSGCSGGHRYAVYGFCKVYEDATNSPVTDKWEHNTIEGHVQPDKFVKLQITAEEIYDGMSGSPILDTTLNRVVGMVSYGKEGKFKRLVEGVTTETMKQANPELKSDSCRIIKYRNRALITLLGLIALLMFTFLIGRPANSFIISRMQSTPTKALVLSENITSTIAPGPTITPPPTPTETVTPSAASTPTATSAPIALLEPTLSCYNRGNSADEIIRNLIQAEAEAVTKGKKDGGMEIIRQIFDPNAKFYDYQKSPAWSWPNPVARYHLDLFQNSQFRNASHIDIVKVDNGKNVNLAYYVSGSKYEIWNGSSWEPQTNESNGQTKYGSDHWTLKKDAKGCWWITEFDFNAGSIPFPPVTP